MVCLFSLSCCFWFLSSWLCPLETPHVDLQRVPWNRGPCLGNKPLALHEMVDVIAYSWRAGDLLLT